MLNDTSQTNGGERLCNACQSGFHPNRKDKKFCSPRCRKNDYSRKNRKAHPHNSTFSPSKRRENLELFDLNRRLVEMIGKEKTSEKRNKIIEDIISLAESGHGKIRSLLTNKIFLKPSKKNSWLFCPKHEHLGTIAQIIDRYSQLVWGCSIVDVLTS